MYLEKMRIKDFVKISEAFSTEVHIKRDFYNKEINFKKLRGYVPSESSRNALKGLLRGFYPQSSYRAHFITGSYGVGKSHLGLVFANYLSLNIENRNLQSLLEKVKEKDDELYKNLISIRSKTKPFLIVIPRPGGDPLGFTNSLIFTLKKTLEKAKIDYEFKTCYSAAINRIRYWEQNKPEAFRRLKDSLDKEHTDLDILIGRLQNYDKDAYDMFCDIHKEVAFGVPFSFEEYVNAEDIYSEVLGVIRKEYDYQGIVIIFDEFGNYLRKMADDPYGEQGLQFQNFLEFCKRSSENQCHLIAIAHMSLKDYAKGKIAQEEWEKIFGRFEGSEYYISFLSKEYEIDDLIDSIIIQHFEGEVWNRIKNDNQWNQLIDIIEKEDLYKNKRREWKEKVIVKGCFPLHPFTTYSLPYISERIGQRTRTLFRFIGDSLLGGFKNFVENNYLYDKNDKFILYTIDKFFDYFETAIKSNEETKSIYKGYENVKVYSTEGSLSERSLKAIGIFSIINSPTLRPTFETIANAINLKIEEREELRDILIELVDKKVLYFKRKTNEYLFPKIIRKDIEEYINKEVESLRPNFNLIKILNSEFSIDLIEARSYNEKKFSNRKADFRYIIPTALSNPQQYLNHINLQYSPERKKYSGDILVLFVICENDEDIHKANTYTSSLECQHPQLVIAVPKNPIEISEVTLRYKALNRLFEKSKLEIKFSELMDEIKDEYIDIRDSIREELNKYREADNIIWYRNKSINSTLKKGGEEEYISEIMYSLFPDTPIIRHNRVAHHIETTDVVKKYRLYAMSKILATKGPIDIKKRGLSAEDAILKAIFLENDMLEKRGDRGISYTYEIKDPLPKTKLGKIWEMLSENILLKDKEIYPEIIIRNLLKSPYGLTHQLIDLLFAAFFRKKSDQFHIVSNCIKALKKNDPKLLQDEVLNEDMIYKLVRNPCDFRLCFYEVPPLLKKYINNLIKIVNPSFELETGVSLYDGVRDELSKWYSEIPEITKNCDKFEYKYTKDFLNIFQKEDTNSRDLILNEVPKALEVQIEYSAWNKNIIKITLDNFKNVVNELNNYHNKIGDKIIEKLANIFNSLGYTDNEVETAIAKWYGNLRESTRLHIFKNDDANILLRQSKISGTIRNKFLVDLPEEYKMDSVINWNSNKTEELINRIQNAKREIDELREITPQDRIKELHKKIKDFILLLKTQFEIKDILEALQRIIKELKVD